MSAGKSEKKFDDTLHSITKSAEKIKSKTTKKKGNKDMKNKTIIITAIVTVVVAAALVAQAFYFYNKGASDKVSEQQKISQAVQDRLEQSKVQR